MSWKKNVFSNLMWSAYTLLTIVGLVELSGAAVRVFRGPSYMGLVLAVIVAALASACVFLFHKFAGSLAEVGQRNGDRLVLVEYALLAFFLIIGLMLRVNGISGAGNGGEYYHAAMVTAGNNVPKVVHGAVYLHLRLLHLVFLVAGNKVTAGIWVQIILQLIAGVLSYFGVKKLVGVIPAQVTFLFFMLAEPMVQASVVLSPEPLFLLLFSVGLLLLALCRAKSDLIYLFIPAGLWIGFMGYLDIGGFFLLLLAAALVLADRDQDTSLKELGAEFGLCLAGTMAGFLVSMFLDSLLSGKSFFRIMNAWQALYGQGPHGFSTSSLADGLYWEGPLLLLMSFGVFSYWRDRVRQHISAWMLLLCLVAWLRYDGMFTSAMTPSIYFILCLSVLAGVGIKAGFTKGEKVFEDRMVLESKAPEAFMEEEYEEDDIASSVKLPKYLMDPESSEFKIPKYLQEEVDAAKPKPDPIPVAEPVPVVEPAEPAAAEPIPMVNEPMPMVNESIPMVNEPIPMVNESIPMVNEPIPMVNEPTPMVNEPTPMVNEPIPMVNESIPMVNEPIPMVNEPIPMVNEPTPMVNESTPMVNESTDRFMGYYSETFVPEAASTPAEEPEPPIISVSDRYAVSTQEEEYEEVVLGQTPLQEDIVPQTPLPLVNESLEEELWEEEIYEPERPKETAVSIEATAPFVDTEPEDKPVSSRPQYIENPLPLPRPHLKKIMDFGVRVSGDEDDYDYLVDDNDDFDIQ